MTGRGKLLAFRGIAIFVALLLVVFVVEAGYRAFMMIDLKRTIETQRIDGDEVIGIVSFPHPMVYNVVYGHDFYGGPFVTGAIKGNRFDFCEVRDQFDSEGNLRARGQGGSSTTKTVALFGSSFTLTTDETGASAADIAAAILRDRLGQ